MGLLHGVLTGQLQASAGTPGPTSDFWYLPTGTMTQAGMRVDKDGAQKIGAWFRGREILATSLAMLPLQVFERLPDDKGSTVARNHPLYNILHDAPNDGDEAFTFKRERMYDLIDFGWAFAWIRPGVRGFADRLIGLDAALVTPERITVGVNEGRWLFHVRDAKTGQSTTHTQDEIFYLRGPEGKGILARARESLGTALATESYAANIFSNGTLNGGVIEAGGAMNEDQMRAMALSFKTAHGDWSMAKIVPAGSKWVPNALTPEDAQMLLSRKFSINDIARWLGLPPHMLGDLDRATFSNIEHQGLEFVTYALGPWLSLWEFASNHQLVLNPLRFYVEFVRDALARGDLYTRWQAYQIQIQTGTVTRNEVRRTENMPKLDGLDEPLTPAFLVGKQAVDTPAQTPAAALLPRAPLEPSRATAIVQASAAQVLRKEIEQVRKLAVRHAADENAFAVAVAEFYAKHVDMVEQRLQLTTAAAHNYCSQQALQVINATDGGWVAKVELWGYDHYAAGLAALALEEAS
jgi:HK97 family phage portal protein